MRRRPAPGPGHAVPHRAAHSAPHRTRPDPAGSRRGEPGPAAAGSPRTPVPSGSSARSSGPHCAWAKPSTPAGRMSAWRCARGGGAVLRGRRGGGTLRFHRLRVLRRMPHPGRGFTQGLTVAEGTVWESTGGYGESALHRYELGAQRPEGRVPLSPELFGEGICRIGAHLWQLTWRERVALRWDARSLSLLGTIPFNREGWGICAAEGFVLTSDGTSELIRRDTAT